MLLAPDCWWRSCGATGSAMISSFERPGLTIRLEAYGCGTHESGTPYACRRCCVLQPPGAGRRRWRQRVRAGSSHSLAEVIRSSTAGPPRAIRPVAGVHMTALLLRLQAAPAEVVCNTKNRSGGTPQVTYEW